ncbi:timeless protein-domain-containing protein [Irpex rosettiformis]|uniref:Timeless protein-domain-containing protein n=1 Tax=Irpex rosettiformis TaxID=378272 RepID=A0ACB8U5C3_9APHY|nr:timeless protein-domain-containing protein [Irpex rosettiformis]
MDIDEVIDISSGEEEEYSERRAILEAPIRNVVESLGGHEGGRYRLGDECYGCLKDLKKFWRKDDTDDERTVARIFWETRVLPNDLIPILLETAGKGMFEDKRAIACADLMTAMTWPIDVAEELKELDEVMDKGTDYTQLIQSHLRYKAAIVRQDVFQALLGIVLPCLAKSLKERTPRDEQVVGVILYLVRNLAFIKDLPPNMHSSADQAEYSSLQNRLIKALSETQMLELLLTMASNGDDDPMYGNYNSLLLEIFYLLLRGVKSSSLASDQSKEPAQNLRRLLAGEDNRKRDIARNASSRHSRFGTTISVTLNPKAKSNVVGDAEAGPSIVENDSPAFVLHRQRALHKEAGHMLDAGKRIKWQKVKKVDELAREENLSLESRLILQTAARTFLETAFNSFLASLLKDIKAERAKISEKDHLRLLYLTKWFLDFFLCQRANDKSATWDFSMITEVTEAGWIVWVLKRMREAMEDKPKLWTELQAGVECLTQLILLIDCMISSGDESIANAAETLQMQIICNGEVLDTSLESVRVYKEGIQSLTYLDSSIHLAYALLKLLEKSSKNGGTGLVRRKKAARRQSLTAKADDTGVPDVEEEQAESEEERGETVFTFDSFEQRFAHPDVTQTLMLYLARYKEFKSPENMKRVVSLLHRQAVRTKAEGLFFKVSTLNLFKSILAEEKSLPREQAYKDLVSLINYILRKFFKEVAEDPFLLVEAFYPKTRGKWKAHSSWEPPEKASRGDENMVENRWPAEVKIKKGFSWSEELGIAIKCLVEDSKASLVEWTKEILIMVIGMRQRIVEDTDGQSSRSGDADNEDDIDNSDRLMRGLPSAEAREKFTDYMIPYVSDEHAEAATKNSELKLVFRLLNFAILDQDANELEWYVPAAIVPTDLQRSLDVINQFMENPIDLGDKKASQMLVKKRRRRRAVRKAQSDSEEEDAEEDQPRRKKRKEKKKKEDKQYKSAQFIEDSDLDDDVLEAFMEKEKALREKMALESVTSGKVATMKATGTKKRRSRRKKEGAELSDQEEQAKYTDASDNSSDSDIGILDIGGKPTSTISTTSPNVTAETGHSRPKPRPRPKPRLRKSSSPITGDVPPVSSSPQAQPSRPSSRSSSRATPLEISDDDDEMVITERPAGTKRKAFIISDDEEE